VARNTKIFKSLFVAAFVLAPCWVFGTAPTATDTWNGLGVNSNTGSIWDSPSNYSSPTAFGSTVDLNFTTLNATTPITLSSTTTGTVSVDDLLFGTATSTITTLQDINFNGNGTTGGTTLSMTGSLTVPHPGDSIVTMGSDLIFKQSTTGTLTYGTGAGSQGSYPVLVINSQVTGGGTSGSMLTVSGNLGLVLNNNSNTYDGILAIGGGNVSYTSINNTGTGSTSSFGTSNLSSGAISLGNQGRLNYIGSGNQTTNRSITFGGSQIDNFATSTSTLTLNGTMTATAGSSATTVTFGVSTGNTTIVAAGIGDRSGGGVTSLIKATGEGYYNANGALTAGNGDGLLILSGTNTYTGTTTVQSGTLQIGSGGTTSTGSLNGTTGTALTFSGGGGTFNVDEASGVSQGMGALTFSSGDGVVQSTNNGNTSVLSFASLAAHATGATADFVLTNGTPGSTNEITLGGVTAGFIGAGYFYYDSTTGADYAYMNTTGGYVRGIKYGTDANSQNDTTGAFFTSNDNVEVSGGSVINQPTQTISTLQISDTSTVSLATTGTLTVGGILKSGGSASSISGGKAITTGNSTDLVIRVDQASDSLAISTAISTSGALTKSGSGTLTLTNTSNSWTNTYLDGGVLQVSGTSFPGNNTLTFSGGNLEWLSGTATNFVSLNLNADGMITTDSGTLTLKGAVTLNTTGGANTLTIAGAGSTIFTSGVISSQSNTYNQGSSIVKTGSGTLTLNGADTYIGTTSVNNGTLMFNSVGPSSNTAQSLGEGSYIYMGVAGASSGILDYTGAAGTLDKNIGVLGNGSDTIENNGTGLLTLSGEITANGTTVNFNGGSNGITVSGTIGGSSASSNVTTTGGTTTFSNANTYVGTTAVNSGATLLISNTVGSALGTSTVNVARGATFGGAGTATGLTAFTVGTGSTGTAQVQVGAGGSDTTGLLTLAATSGTITNANLTYNLSSTTAGQGNQLNLGSTALASTTFNPSNPSTVTLNVVGAGTIANNTSYVLMTDLAGFSSTGLTFVGGGSDAGSSTTDVITGGLTIASNSYFGPSGTYANSYLFLTDNGDQIDVMTVASVPEPSTWAMLAGGLALMVFWSWRRSRLGGSLFVTSVPDV
jgi:autotransporter-associated beta strand protein